MKKLLVYICTLMIAFMFVSCQTSSKPTPPAAPTGIHNTLDGKWNGTVSWRSEFRTGSYILSIMIQEGTVVIESEIGTEIGTLEGNIIHVESTSWLDSTGLRDIRMYYPDRDYIISEDGNTITMNFQGSWNTLEIDDANGFVEVQGILTRE
jgi:hypothetical protein